MTPFATGVVVGALATFIVSLGVVGLLILIAPSADDDGRM